MRLADFETLVRRLQTEVPAEYLDGVMEIEVSRNALPHPTRADIYTLGECIPLPLDHQDSPGGVLSRIVLYYGSFQALARLDSDFDWFAEAWETLTHELRHHLEWRARAPDLENFDWAAEQNFARQDGERFDPLFYRSGEKVTEGIYRLDDDFFLEHEAVAPGSDLQLEWHGRRYVATVPSEATLPAFLTLDGIEEPPPGDLVVVLPAPSGLGQLFRSTRFQATVPATMFPPTSPPLQG
jgi:hypothetical protein